MEEEASTNRKKSTTAAVEKVSNSGLMIVDFMMGDGEGYGGISTLEAAQVIIVIRSWWLFR
eukprot:scaffold619_cov150-Skeletonema_menzelii.AAC.12